jgi:ATP-dependent Clp protease ATP-binding subunit ClpC
MDKHSLGRKEQEHNNSSKLDKEEFQNTIRALTEYLISKDLQISSNDIVLESKDKDKGKDKDFVKKFMSLYDEERKEVKEIILPEIERTIRELIKQREELKHKYNLHDPNIKKDKNNLGLNKKELKDLVRDVENKLLEKVLGQEQAIRPLVAALKRFAAGLRDEKRPIMSALAVGRTGVGKTFLAKELAKALSSDNGVSFGFIPIDCSEFSHGHEGSRLTGAPPGFIGYGSPSHFDALRKNPFQVVLFDEIEKASGQLHNLLLQILEEGQITLGNGEKLSFKNSIIIMTSNVGVSSLDKAKNPFGLNTRQGSSTLTQDEVLELTSEALKDTFRPEFLNRIDEIVAFNDIDKKTARKIADLEIGYVIDRATQNNLGAEFVLGSEVTQLIIKNGYSEEYGAREIRRAVQKIIELPLADAIVNCPDEELEHSTFYLDVKNSKLNIERIYKGKPNQDTLRPAA